MRTTKALLCAAAVAAGAVSSMAQSNVYSLNVVGYINLSVTNGYNLIANQLDIDGKITNNTLQSVFGTNLPAAAKFVSYSGGAFASATYAGPSTGKWSGNTNAANAALSPGGGGYLYIPNGAIPTITLVGNVVQGTNVQQIVAGSQIVSAIPPVSGTIQSLGYVPTAADKVIQYNAFTKAFTSHTYSSGTTWSAGQPTPTVGEAFWLQAKKNTNWVQAFTVQ